MTEWCWLNGTVLPLADATVSVEDRGFQFADGVYEAVRLYDGKPFELPLHLDRLERSLAGIRLAMPLSKDSLALEILKLVKHAQVRDGYIYLQITRGRSTRNHLFPADATSTTFFYVRALPQLSEIGCGSPYTLMSIPDERWNKCWIKCVGLIENVLAKNAAADAGADEAIFIHEGNVTEGSSSNVFMVKNGTLITHPVGAKVLPGVTRDVLLRCAKTLKIPLEERALSLEDAKRAQEVFITSSTRELVWVSKWDGTKIASECGTVTKRLHVEYRKCIADSRR